MKEASLYTVLTDERVRCDTCAHHCVIEQGARGFCGTKENRDGKLLSLVYGKCAAMHADPIEKKPLYHFLPGKQAFSMATVGCNLKCLNCQNASISQIPSGKPKIGGQLLSPERLVEIAETNKCPIIAYTYSEPAVFWDYAFDIALLAAERDIKNVFVTNGFWSEIGLEKMLPYIDGANIDLKFFSNQKYKKICQAELKPVLDTIRRMKESDVWVEITTLLIPGLNDSDEELQQIASFIYDLDPDIPWHISSFHPTYKMTDRPVTSPEALEKARDVGFKTGLRYIYSGYAPERDTGSTFCPKCGSLMIRRWGFKVMENRLYNGRCPDCSEPIPGVWKKQIGY